MGQPLSPDIWMLYKTHKTEELRSLTLVHAPTGRRYRLEFTY
jgi:hypothetical protein